MGGVAPDRVGEYHRVVEPGTDHVFLIAGSLFIASTKKRGLSPVSLKIAPREALVLGRHRYRSGLAAQCLASAPRASSGVLFVCERCAAITCLSRLRSSAASISPEVRLSRCPRRLAMRVFSAAG